MEVKLTVEEFNALLQAARMKAGLSSLEAMALDALLQKARQQINDQQQAKEQEQDDGDN